jgi:glycosyltransferase involved in cell wall biosynthesis
MSRIRVLYTAFDVYPGRKGAQAHIRSNLRALAGSGGQATLLCLGPGGSFRDPDNGAMVHAYAASERNMLRRSELFGRFLADMADTMIVDPPEVIHFRDIWSGIPLLSHGLSSDSRIVFEVNGLPSVELPSHYPRLSGNSSLLARLRRMEDECLSRADRVITVCRRTARYLTERGCEESKIVVIPNAADPPGSSPRFPAEVEVFEETASRGEKVILYAGTLAPWQGLHTLLEAVAFLGHRRDFHLVVAASSAKGVARFRKLLLLMGLSERVTILAGVHHRAMPFLYTRAYLSTAPLARGARNELQGCCPLKIVESMACGTPVIASDLPAVRELIDSGADGMLVSPGSSRALAGGLEVLLDNGAMRDRLAAGACDRARREFGTRLYAKRLCSVYTEAKGGNRQ